MLGTVTTLPATADYAVTNKLGNEAGVFGVISTTAAAETGKKPAEAGFSTFTTTGITTPVTFADATMTYALDATAKIYTFSTTATYTGADEAAAKTVYDQALSGASATIQGVATEINSVKLAKTQVIALVAGSLSNIVAAASAIAALSMAF